jgi:predicted nucleic acid-binding protein
MYILDTNVVSEIRKIRLGKADKFVSLWAESVNTAELYLSVITLQELEIGVSLAEHSGSTKGILLRSWLDNHVMPAFSGRILPIDNAVAIRSAKLHVPNPRPVRDGLIAATALVHGMTVVTRNVSDFKPCGVMLINPWEYVAK